MPLPNPPEPVERRPKPTPAPPVPLDRGYRAIAREGEDLTNPKPPRGGTAIEPPMIAGEGVPTSAPPPAASTNAARNLELVRENATHGLKLGVLVQGEESQYRVTQLDARYCPNNNQCGVIVTIMLQKEKPTPAPPLDDADVAIQSIATIEQILALLERIPCMSEDCGGTGKGAHRAGRVMRKDGRWCAIQSMDSVWTRTVCGSKLAASGTTQSYGVPDCARCMEGMAIGNDESATKDQPSPTRCHRCAAMRLAKSVVNG